MVNRRRFVGVSAVLVCAALVLTYQSCSKFRTMDALLVDAHSPMTPVALRNQPNTVRPNLKLDPAERDPFMPIELRHPPSVALQVVTVPLLTEANPPAPAMNYRLIGRMVGTDGAAVVYLVSPDEQPYLAHAGEVLPGGWEVVQVEGNDVHLLHARSGTRSVLNLPDLQ